MELVSSNLVRALIIDQSGVPWIGTRGGGLNQYDQGKDAFIRYQHDPDDPHSLSNNVIRTVYEDRDKTIWVGTMGEGERITLERDQCVFSRGRISGIKPSI